MSEYPFTNHLVFESSPYLLEHAHNPVLWYPWGEEALTKARTENKPIIISIGYAACHWCHIMEHESFSDVSVADFMNAHFISIKVDREERPDIDQIYMNAAMLVSGHGGWPLNAFALPDGRPFYAATYFPKERWLQILMQIKELYQTQWSDLELQAESLTQGINQPEFISVHNQPSPFASLSLYSDMYLNIQPHFDNKMGGFNGAPKFPLPMAWEFVLQYYYITNDSAALNAVLKTLGNMAMGGIYDQIGGGFSRYTIDEQWEIPHFEKMLYDNAQLVSLYSHGFAITKNSLYSDIIRETLHFIQSKMTTSEGAFYSSLNADSEGIEGKFYVWTKSEIESVLSAEYEALISEFYQISDNGNWENGRNILYYRMLPSEFAHNKGISESAFYKILHESKQQLLNARNQRICPSTDDKILTSWNALMLSGYIEAWSALGEDSYLKTALKNAHFILDKLKKPDGSLWHSYKNNKSSITGFLDDYAFLCEAFIHLYKATFDIQWLHQAKALTEYVILHFLDRKRNMFYYTSDESEILIARKMEIPDNVIPSSNSAMAINLYILGIYFDRSDWVDLSKKMLISLINDITQRMPYYSNWAFLSGLIMNDSIEIVIMGKEAPEVNKKIQELYLPTAIFAGGDSENLPALKGKKAQNKTRMYLCQNQTCQAPTENMEDFLKELTLLQTKYKKY